MEDCIISEPLPDIYHIETPGNVFVTLVLGKEQALLVDTGLGICDLKSVVRKITPLPIVVMNTHGHNDHIAGNYQFDNVLLNPADFSIAQFALCHEIRENVIRIRDVVKAPDGYWEYHLENISELSPETEFDLGDIHPIVLPFPNHTPGSLCVYVPEKKLLIGADSIAPFTSLFFPEAVSVKEHINIIFGANNLDFSYLLTSHSSTLYPHSILHTIIRCAEHYNPSQTLRYRDPYFPLYKGRMFFYQDISGDIDPVILVAKHDDED